MQDHFENTWLVIDKYFGHNKGYQLIKHLVDSYNDFVLRKLDDIIEGFNPIVVHHQFMPEHEKFKYELSIDIKNPVISKPLIYEKDGSTKLMTPNDARTRNFTYSAPLFVDVHINVKVYNSETSDYIHESKKINSVNLGKLPIMVRSKYCILYDNPIPFDECKFDYGGYFIINGNEKVVISQDRIAENKTYVFLSNKPGPYSHVAEIRSVQENKFSVPKTTALKLSSKPNQFGRFIRANIHHIKHDIPVMILFRALGVETDKDIVQYIVYDINHPDNELIINELCGSIEEANIVTCSREALEYLSRYLNINGYPKEILNNKAQRIEILRDILSNEFLPHVGTDFYKKALYLGFMINKLLKCYLGLLPYDDRDSYINKRIDTPGILLANLFRQAYGKVVKDMKNMIQKDINTGSWRATNKFINVINKININKIVKSTTIESALKYGLATGNWGIKTNKTKQGVAQVLNRLTYSSTISHLRRINTPIEKTGKLVQPRKLHSTQWGIICPAECFDPETPILTWDGVVKKAEEIKVGDFLVDDTGNAVKVKSTCSGFKDMYEIVPCKKNFMSYTVTSNHILTLKVRNYKFDNVDEVNMLYSSLDDDNVIDITIEKYLELPAHVQKNLYLFKSNGINWKHKDVAIDPYILGMWLGDGLSSGFGFVTADKELLDKWIEWGKDNDALITSKSKYKYLLGSIINSKQPGSAPLKKLLEKYNLVNNKHIPLDYVVNSRETRLALLAGIVDTDGSVRANGHEIRICQGQKNYRIIYDVEFLARSLGFSCHMSDGVCTYSVNGEKRQKPYKELTITGTNLYEIPTVLPRKKLSKFGDPYMEKRGLSFLQSSFALIKKEVQPYVGWQVEGSGRFLLADMSITHNTPEGVSVGLVKNMSLISNITIASNSHSLRDLLKTTDIVMFDGSNIVEFATGTKVIVNGDIIGVHHEPQTLVNTLKQWKHTGQINVYTSICWWIYRNEIWICTEGGRCVRPCYIVNENGNIRLDSNIVKMIKSSQIDWTGLVIGTQTTQPLIEYLDVEETNMSMIAMKISDLANKDIKNGIYPINYTHLELDASLILGILAGSIPFSDHNQSPRNCYQCLGLHERVLMANGSTKAIKDVKVGDAVVTFDPRTMNTEITKVIHHYVKKTDKEMFMIKTCSGRTIKATYDHKFMTSTTNFEFQWKEVKDFNILETLVGIYPYVQPLSSTMIYEPCTLISKERVENTLIKQCVSKEMIEMLLQEFDRMNISELTNTFSMTPTIARLYGYLAYNKNIRFLSNYEVLVYFTHNHDAECFVNDVQSIGFKAEKSSLDASVKLDKWLTLFILVLSENDAGWIQFGSPRIKQEFLGGVFGANGPYLTWNTLYGITSRKSSNIINPVLVALLLKEFGIRTVNDDNTNHIQLDVDYENIIKVFDTIGYRYNTQQTVSIGSLVEFARAEVFSPGTQCITSWLSKVVCHGSMIFIPIKSIERINNTLISDITVESEHHCFIGGDAFAVHNSAMGKQAIGIYTSNYQKRYDTLGHILNYPQVPLVQTRASKIVNNDKLPCGVNVIVAIGCWTGFNQEDSIIMNQSSVDRGLFRSTYYRTYKEHNIKNHSTGEEEYFCKPDSKTTKQIKPFNYDKLNPEGFVEENKLVEAGDIIIGKCMPQKNGNVILNKDTSVVLKNNEKGFIDRNCYNDKYFTNINGDGYSFAKVRIRSDRVPCIGDKFSCYTPDHEILTDSGWIAINQLTTQHKVATLVDDCLVYQNPTEVQTYDYKGKIYCVKSNHVDLRVTPNHRMYVKSKTPGAKYRMELAEDIYGARRHYKKNAENWVPDLTNAPKELVIENGHITKFFIEGYVNGNQQLKEDMYFDINNWLEFFGIWLAEGNVTKGCYVQFAANKPRVKEALDRLAKQLGLTIYKQKHHKTDTEENDWRIHTQPLPRFMDKYSVGAVNKQLPEWVWYLDRDQCNVLLQGMCLGDGHVMTNGTQRYDTSSVMLAGDFQRLCLHAGFSANRSLKCAKGYSKTKKDGSVITTTTDAFRLTINTKQNEPLVNKTKIVGDESSYLDSWEEYEGTVHCCTVPNGHGVLYIRRNGVPVWSGNSRHGQKGTVGMLYRHEDMPFDSDGIVPDIIINPHAIPSRMTIAQLMETIMGNACCGLGTFGDATPFTSVTVEDIAKACEHAGLERYGNKVLYNSRTGEQMDAYIFMGVTNYQRLKHMVDDKVHSRAANGPVVSLTRQPAEGRARDGGLRLGEMEIECNWAHGTMQFLKERFMECSDNYRVFVCKKCGIMANVNPEKNLYNCKSCKNTTCFSEIRIPYSCKLLFQEIQTMGIAAKFMT